MNELKLGAVEKGLFKKAVEATKAGKYIHAAKGAVKKLVEAGYVEISEDSQWADDKGRPAVVATQAGIEAFEGVAQKAEIQAASEFELETGIEMPTSRRGGRSGSKYPFGAMTPGMSFHIPATEACPNPAKSVASSVTLANRKYAENGVRFVARVAAENDPKGPGGRVFCEAAKA